MIIDLKNCVITFKDGTGSPVTLALNVGEGNITWSEKNGVEYRTEKGSLSGAYVRAGDEVPVDVSFDLIWDYLTTKAAEATFTVEEIVKGLSSGSQVFVTAGADLCAPYAVDIEIVHTPSSATVDDETITLGEFRWESMEHDPKAGTVACTGKCFITAPTIVRDAQG